MSQPYSITRGEDLNKEKRKKEGHRVLSYGKTSIQVNRNGQRLERILNDRDTVRLNTVRRNTAKPDTGRPAL